MEHLWMIVLFVLGFFMTFKPELLWKIEHCFSVKDGEPTELYLGLMRIAGIVFLIAAIICLAVIIL